jgi:hypothetical protein
MIAHNPNSLCKQAEPYYYDFLYSESRGLIPESIVNHVEQCQHCREQTNQLKAVLSQADGLESQQSQVGSAVTTMLKLHFAYVGKPVTCNIVKPFLPTLLDQTLGMRIPTPIVTHVYDCQQCSGDLDVIRCLNLDRKQLCRLSQLFAEKPAVDDVACSKARADVDSVITMFFQNTNAQILKHFCTCSGCRELLYQRRQEFRDGLLQKKITDEKFSCDNVSAAHIFDYVVPYGIDPANDQYAKFRRSLISHLVYCPNCLAKMQQLHQTIYGIAERAESEVVTIYHIDESAKAEAISESDDIYAGFPIRVERANRGDEVNAGRSASSINFGVALKQKVSAMNLKPLVKTAVAAAAIILIAAALFFNIPTAKAVAIEQIYKAIEKVKNVYIASFVAGKREPIQKLWASRTLNNYMTKTGKKLVLWDLTNRVKKVKHFDSGSTETTLLSDDVIAKIEKKISVSFGLMPFPNLSEIPHDAEWSRVIDDGLKATAKGAEAYDLTWVAKVYGGPVVFKKWRVFIDPETNLPHKTEIYRKVAADSQYTLRSIVVVEYLSGSEIQAVIKEASF